MLTLEACFFFAYVQFGVHFLCLFSKYRFFFWYTCVKSQLFLYDRLHPQSFHFPSCAAEWQEQCGRRIGGGGQRAARVIPPDMIGDTQPDLWAGETLGMPRQKHLPD